MAKMRERRQRCAEQRRPCANDGDHAQSNGGHAPHVAVQSFVAERLGHLLEGIGLPDQVQDLAVPRTRRGLINEFRDRDRDHDEG